MAASLLRIGRLGCIKCLQAGKWSTLSKAPLAVPFSTKSGNFKKGSQKNTSGKKQAKTYFDIEKLVQHKPCEVFPAQAATAKPSEQSIPAAALPESVVTVSEVKAGEQLVEASSSFQAIPDPASTAEVTPAAETPPAGEAVFESAGAVPVMSEATATATEATHVVESMAEAMAPAKDLAESPVTEAGTVIVESPIEAATEAPLEMPVEAKPQFMEAAPELVSVEAPSVDETPEPLFKASLVDMAPEPTAKDVLVDVSLEPVVKAVPDGVAQEAATEAAPVEVATSPIEAEVFLTTEAAAEISVPVEMAEKLVDKSPVTAEAAGEGLQQEVPAEPTEVKSPLEAATEVQVEMPLEVKPLESEQFVQAAPESVSVEAPPVEDDPEPLFKASSIDVAPEPAAKDALVDVSPQPVAEAAPTDVVPEPADEALPVDVVLEPAVTAVPASVTQEAVIEAAPVLEAFEPLAEAAPVEVATPPIEGEVFPTTGAAAEICVPEMAEKLVDQSPVIAEAAGEELQEEVPAESTEISEAHMDPIQKLFLDSIREYSAKSQATGGLVDAGSEYEKALVEEITKLQRLYGGGDLTSFPEFKFKEPNLDEVSQK